MEVNAKSGSVLGKAPCCCANTVTNIGPSIDIEIGVLSAGGHVPVTVPLLTDIPQVGLGYDMSPTSYST